MFNHHISRIVGNCLALGVANDGGGGEALKGDVFKSNFAHARSNDKLCVLKALLCRDPAIAERDRHRLAIGAGDCRCLGHVVEHTILKRYVVKRAVTAPDVSEGLIEYLLNTVKLAVAENKASRSASYLGAVVAIVKINVVAVVAAIFVRVRAVFLLLGRQMSAEAVR